MKKLIAWCLALTLLLLPVVSLAEDGAGLTVRYAMDSDAWSAITGSVGESASSEDTAAMMSAVCELVNSVALRVQWQSNGVRVAVDMQDSEVFSGALTWTDEQLIVTSTLLPELALTCPKKELDDFLTTAAEVDWPEIQTELWNEACDWYDSLTLTREAGSFIGEVYAGGTSRETIRLDDRDVALLVDGALLRLEAREDVTALLNALLGDSQAATFFAQCREYNHHVALENRYGYLVRRVMDDAGATIGYSATVLDEGRQVGSASIGLTADGANCLIDSGNMYYDLTLRSTRDGDTTHTTSSMRVVTDDTGVGSYAEAAKLPQNIKLETSTEQTMTGDEQAFTIVAQSVASQTDANGNPIVCREDGETTYTADPFTYRQTTAVRYGDSETPLMTARVEGQAQERFTVDTAGASFIDLTAMDDEANTMLSQALQQGTNALTIKLFKAVPPTFLQLLLEMFN